MSFNRYDGPGRTYFPDEAEESRLKLEYAVALLRNPDDPFAAARVLFGEDTSRALYASSAWVRDPAVKAECARLLDEHGEEAFLPTKAEYARRVIRLADHPNTPVQEKQKLLSLYGDIRGFKAPREGIVINDNRSVDNRVMLVKDHGDDDAWRAAAEAQQHRLLMHGKTLKPVAAPVVESDVIDV